MDEFATHGLSCKMSAGHLPQHAAINTNVKMSLARAQIPSVLEPVGLCRSDGKRPDGVTITSWQAGRTLVWDVTCPDTYAVSHVVLATREVGAVATSAEVKKSNKYEELARPTMWLHLPLRPQVCSAQGRRNF